MGPTSYLSDVLPPTEARALAAVIVIYNRAGRVTLDDVIAETGISRTPNWVALRRLHERGLITWEPRKMGTLTPRVWPIARAT